MNRPKPILFLLLVIFLLSPFLISSTPSESITRLQETSSLPTVTGTPKGPTIFVPDQVNVRIGPGTDYELVGVLIAGQLAPAVGRSIGGDWIQIVYPGVPGDLAWVYAPLVRLDAGQSTLPIVEPPPTPTPRVTATIDPTLAAQFDISGSVPTRLPTFTPAPPIVQPTFAPVETQSRGGFPPILAMAGLVMVGTFGIFISFLRDR